MKAKASNRSRHITISSFLFVLIALALATLASSCTQGQTQSTGAAESSGATTAPPVETAAQTVTPSVVPAAPSDLTGKVVAVFDVLVDWMDNSNNEDGFHIYRQRTDVNGDLSEVGMADANATAFADLYTYCGETYQYVVASFNFTFR